MCPRCNIFRCRIFCVFDASRGLVCVPSLDAHRSGKQSPAGNFFAFFVDVFVGKTFCAFVEKKTNFSSKIDKKKKESFLYNSGPRFQRKSYNIARSFIVSCFSSYTLESCRVVIVNTRWYKWQVFLPSRQQPELKFELGNGVLMYRQQCSSSISSILPRRFHTELYRCCA